MKSRTNVSPVICGHNLGLINSGARLGVEVSSYTAGIHGFIIVLTPLSMKTMNLQSRSSETSVPLTTDLHTVSKAYNEFDQ